LTTPDREMNVPYLHRGVNIKPMIKIDKFGLINFLV